MNELAIIIFATSVVSLTSLVGVFTLSFSKSLLNKSILFLVSLAAGAFIGDVFLHIIPHIVEDQGEFKIDYSIAIIVGLLSFLVLEKMLHWHHSHGEDKKQFHPIAINNLIADGVHNFVDGMIIAASFQVSTELGLATTIAVIAHEIPQEIGDFGILLHSGLSKTKALIFNFTSALLSLIGALMAYGLGERVESASSYLVAFAAGAFIYIAVADLIPELKHEKELKNNLIQIAFVFLGIILMFGVLAIEPEHSHDYDSNHGHEENEANEEHENDLEHEEDWNHSSEENNKDDTNSEKEN